MEEQADDSLQCRSCKVTSTVTNQMSRGNCFLYLPLEEQLKTLFLQKDVIKHVSHEFEKEIDPNVISDICDGALYQQLSDSPESPLRSPNISLTCSCDGVPIFKSSSFSIWPLLCIINELPVFDRQKHVMLCGLWFGNSKPNMNVYLQPFVEEILHLQTQGFTWQTSFTTNTTRVYPLVLVCDSVARPVIQNFKQFNGEYGCSFCLQRGDMVEKGKGYTRVYPFESCELRTQAQTEEHIECALESGMPVKGVKGPSILLRVPHFNIIESCVPDYMHSVSLGIARTMAKLWLSSENHQTTWYIGRSIHMLDERLLGIRPPCNVSRIPRSLKDRKF